MVVCGDRRVEIEDHLVLTRPELVDRLECLVERVQTRPRSPGVISSGSRSRRPTTARLAASHSSRLWASREECRASHHRYTPVTTGADSTPTTAAVRMRKSQSSVVGKGLVEATAEVVEDPAREGDNHARRMVLCQVLEDLEGRRPVGQQLPHRDRGEQLGSLQGDDVLPDGDRAQHPAGGRGLHAAEGPHPVGEHRVVVVQHHDVAATRGGEALVERGGAPRSLHLQQSHPLAEPAGQVLHAWSGPDARRAGSARWQTRISSKSRSVCPDRQVKTSSRHRGRRALGARDDREERPIGRVVGGPLQSAVEPVPGQQRGAGSSRATQPDAGRPRPTARCPRPPGSSRCGGALRRERPALEVEPHVAEDRRRRLGHDRHPGCPRQLGQAGSGVTRQRSRPHGPEDRQQRPGEEDAGT